MHTAAFAFFSGCVCEHLMDESSPPPTPTPAPGGNIWLINAPPFTSYFLICLFAFCRCAGSVQQGSPTENSCLRTALMGGELRHPFTSFVKLFKPLLRKIKGNITYSRFKAVINCLTVPSCHIYIMKLYVRTKQEDIYISTKRVMW